MRFDRCSCFMLVAFAGLQSNAVQAQQAVDHGDPAVIQNQAADPELETAGATIAIERDSPSSSQSIERTDVFVGAVTLSELHALSPADFADIIERFVGRSNSASELATMADEVANRMRARGYAFASAWIEPQQVANGVLVVRVDEGRIDEVRFEGAVTRPIRRALEPLCSGGPVRMQEVELRLLLAADIDGVRVQSTRFIREGERGVLVVRVTRERIAVRAIVSNAGTRPIGPEQARIELDMNGVLASDDSLSMSYSTTPAQPRELQFGYVRYEKRVSAAGTEVALVGLGSVTRPGSYLAPLNIHNRSWSAAATVLHPLLRRRKASLWFEGELGIRNLSQWRSGRRVRDDQLVTARATVYGYSDLAGGRLRMSGTLSQGLGILDSIDRGDSLASRSDADGTFTTVALWADWTRDLGGQFSVRLAARGQLSSQPLLISEEISLGGTGFLRGYDWASGAETKASWAWRNSATYGKVRWGWHSGRKFTASSTAAQSRTWQAALAEVRSFQVAEASGWISPPAWALTSKWLRPSRAIAMIQVTSRPNSTSLSFDLFRS